MPKELCNLDTCFLCRNCYPEWKELIEIKKTTVSFKKGKQIINEGEKVKGIYFMYSGLVKVHMQWVNQKELIVRFAKKGDIVGIRGLGDRHVYPISVTAITDTKLCFIPNNFLESTLKVNQQFTYQLMHYYANELQHAEKRMRNLVHMEVKSRVAEALIELASIFNSNTNSPLEITLNRQDIASYAGTTYETVFKFFIELTKKKIISLSGKTIKINQPEKLKSFIAEP
jgi:CRP/FNR family transcriptional regulator